MHNDFDTPHPRPHNPKEAAESTVELLRQIRDESRRTSALMGGIGLLFLFFMAAYFL